MRVVVAAVGRLKRGPERDLLERYCARAAAGGRAVGLRGVEVMELDESRARRIEDRLEEGAAALNGACPDGGVVIALEEGGEGLSSLDFARRLVRWRDGGISGATFMIGGPVGLAESLKSRAEFRLAFGPAT